MLKSWFARRSEEVGNSLPAYLLLLLYCILYCTYQREPTVKLLLIAHSIRCIESKIDITCVGIEILHDRLSDSKEISRLDIPFVRTRNITPKTLETCIDLRPVFGSLQQIIPDKLGCTPLYHHRIGPARGPISTKTM